MEGLEHILAEHPFFAGFDARHLEIVQGCVSNRRCEVDQYVLREGEPADEFYLIRHGRIALEISSPGRKPVVVETIGAGEIVGASWLISPYRWMFDARALELTRLIGIDAACLREKCKRDHDFGYQMMKRFLPILAKRLHATRMQILDVYGKH
ncbi:MULTISPECIES: cyclic nucleotide-binding domain-containing protein [unclassified Burkholderia]|uniref:cyclic nucleotide-binding domain-containing protein n=1 Tax=unclassified Burkholderia TaxID=2613784 RepID=UPI00075B8000|nr:MULTISPECIES: cyclic nucleotide-binding domain-containing protein [unclassified Burkholderia]KUY61023.1 Crp/Fnr family transcriptional regulator [Burkholderia sp. RF2-non_BP3]KUY85937.1 Crp/Fnr family transcriptional regulator [Burkholderia sp. RF4-BP95]KUY92810.1 Crp/Fnr family transcriptional regulator [Burkholderia sp. RF7-non_BP4]KUY95317.1 Crp/Fnr family transcriptional regulator [Burkholderia sp. RF7-non_BP1]